MEWHLSGGKMLHASFQRIMRIIYLFARLAMVKKEKTKREIGYWYALENKMSITWPRMAN